MPQLLNNEAASRYELREGQHVLGFAEYHLEGNVLTLPHTEVAAGEEGAGLGSQLAHFALTDAQTRGLDVVPSCPFIADYIQRHPQYLTLVPAAQRH